MNRIGIALLTTVVGAIFVFGTCGGNVPATPNARIAQILDKGGTVRFEWDAVSDADGYRVYADGVQQYEGTNLYYEHSSPTALIEVTAYNGEGESSPKKFDFSPTLSSGVEVWDATDPDPAHPSYVEFVNGTATPRNASEKGNAWMLFVQDSVSTNSQNNSSVDAAFSEITGAIGDADIAPTEGNYLTRDKALEGSQYYIWFEFSPIDGQIGANDYFAKMKITTKTGSPAKYTVDFYFQTVQGVRWLVTP